MANKKKMMPEMPMAMPEYEGRVRDDFLRAARDNSLLNDLGQEGGRISEFDQKDFQATITHLEAIGDIAGALHLRDELARYQP